MSRTHSIGCILGLALWSGALSQGCTYFLGIGGDYDVADPPAPGSDDGGAGVCEAGAEMACYPGPDGTQGLGLCEAGLMTCRVDGSGFSECEGAILPHLEDCLKPGDENCDGIDGCSGEPVTALGFGDSSAQSGTALAINGAGDVVVTGFFYGSLGSGIPATSLGASDIFLMQLDPTFKPRWITAFGNDSYQSATALALGTSGEIVLTGKTVGALNFGGGDVGGGVDEDLFIAELDASGGHRWSHAFGGAMSQIGTGVAIDASGNVVLVGKFQGTLDLSGAAGPTLTSAGLMDIFVAKFSPTGAVLWARRFGGPEDQEATGVAVDSKGDVNVVGSFTGALSFDPATPLSPPSVGDVDIFAAKLKGQDGKPLVSASFGGSGQHWAASVAISAEGGPIVGGQFKGTLGVGGTTLMSVDGADGVDGFLMELTPDLAGHFVKHFKGQGDQQVTSAAVDAAGAIVAVGSFSGSMDVDGELGMTSTGKVDAFVVKLGADGTRLWGRRFGDGSSQMALGVAIDALGSPIITGSFEGSLKDVASAVTSAGSSDVFLARFSP